MSLENLIRTLWRRKWTVILITVVATVATYAIASALPKVYSATATVGVNSTNPDASDLEEYQLPRVYITLISSEEAAENVIDELALDDSPQEVLGKVTFEPVQDTTLVSVTAEEGSARDAERLANGYAFWAAKYVEDALSDTADGTSGVANFALTPEDPVRPQPGLYAGVMFVLSLLLGCGFALFREGLDARLGSQEEVADALGLPVLAQVPVTSVSRSNGVDPIRETRLLEAFRVLWTNLQLESTEDPMASVLVTSPGAGEGKSTCAMAVARVAAESGHRVTLIEGDMRRPGFSGDNGGKSGGLAKVLADGTPFEELLESTAIPNLFLLPAGSSNGNPVNLLQVDRLQALVGEASIWSDLVVIDSPPLSAGSDALLLAQAVDRTVLVLSSRRTDRSRARAATRELSRAHANIVGVVLNEVSDANAGYDGYYDAGSERRRGRSLAAALSTPGQSAG